MTIYREVLNGFCVLFIEKLYQMIQIDRRPLGEEVHASAEGRLFVLFQTILKEWNSEILLKEEQSIKLPKPSSCALLWP